MLPERWLPQGDRIDNVALTYKLCEIGYYLSPNYLRNGLIKSEILTQIDPLDMEVIRELFSQTIIDINNCLGVEHIRKVLDKYFLHAAVTWPDLSKPEKSLTKNQREDILLTHIYYYIQKQKEPSDKERRKNYYLLLKDLARRLLELLNQYLLRPDCVDSLIYSDLIYPSKRNGVSIFGFSLLDKLVFRLSGQRFNIYQTTQELRLAAKIKDDNRISEILFNLKRQLEKANLTESRRLTQQEIRELRQKSNRWYV